MLYEVITEPDVLEYAGSSLTNEDVLRAIGENREWSQNRRVKFLLVSNPRTPTSLALRFLGHLAVAEWNQLARNKNIPAAVAREAKRRVVVARNVITSYSIHYTKLYDDLSHECGH